MTPKDASKYLGRLYEAGRIRKPQRGLYTPVGDGVSGGNNPPTPTKTPTSPPTDTPPYYGEEVEVEGQDTHTEDLNPDALKAEICTVCGKQLGRGQIARDVPVHPACANDEEFQKYYGEAVA